LLAVAVAIILLWGGGAAAAELALFTGRAEISLEELSLTAPANRRAGRPCRGGEGSLAADHAA
jgi:hypothetical protein